MILNKNNLEVVLNNNSFFRGGETLGGTVILEVNEPQGIQAECIKVRIICAADVRIGKDDQIKKEDRQTVSQRSKLFDEEIELISEMKYLDFGLHDFSFSFKLPSEDLSFPPTCSHRINNNTKASISHYVKAIVKRSRPSFFTKGEFSAKENFSFVPTSMVPREIEREELGFVTQVSPYGGGKVIGKMSELSSNMSYYSREVRESLPSGTNSLGRLLKATTGLGPKKQPDVSLICKVILPSKRVKQDVPVGFTISLATASTEQQVVLKSIRVRINTVLLLNVKDKSFEKVVDTLPVFQRSMIQTGNHLSVKGDLTFDRPLLPTFHTPSLAYFHTLEFILEVSNMAHGQINEATQLIEQIPTALFSYFSKPRVASQGDDQVYYQNEKAVHTPAHSNEACATFDANSEISFFSPKFDHQDTKLHKSQIDPPPRYKS